MLLMAALPIACSPSCALGGAKPNGKKNVLFFITEALVVAQGLTTTVKVPQRHAAGGAGKVPTPDLRVYDYDFSGVTFEATGPGLELVSAAPGTNGWDLVVRCTESAAEDAELSVKVLSGGAARYEDAIDLHCARATRLDVSELKIPVNYIDGLALPADRVAVGASVHFKSAIFGNFKGSEVALAGRGLSMADPNGPLLVSQTEVNVLNAVRPGAGSILVAGAARATLPTEVVAIAGLTLQVEASVQRFVVPPFLQASAKGSNSGGDVTGLTGCTFEHFTPDGGEVERFSPDGGAIDAGPIDVPFCTLAFAYPPDAGQVCASWSGQRACARYVFIH
jgi:hypothetical protein